MSSRSTSKLRFASRLPALVSSPLGFALIAWLATSVVPAVAWAADEAEGEHGHAKGAHSILPTVWAIVSFLLVLAIIWKKLLPPILGALDARSTEIRESLAAADRAKAEAQELMQRHQSDLEAARREAQSIIEEGKADAERVRARIVADAEREAKDLSTRAVREIDLAKQAALQELHLKSVDLSFDLANRLIRKNLNPSDHQELIQERIRELESKS